MPHKPPPHERHRHDVRLSAFLDRDRIDALLAKLVRDDDDRGFVVRRWHEQTAPGIDLQAEHGRGVQVREEDQDVVLMVVALDVLQQRRAPRALLPQPLQLVVLAVLVVEDPLGVAVERLNVARTRVGETPHGDAAHAVRSFGVFVVPGDVILRAGRQHVDLVPRRKPLRDQPAVVLGPPQDLGTVPLDDECNPQT